MQDAYVRISFPVLHSPFFIKFHIFEKICIMADFKDLSLCTRNDSNEIVSANVLGVTVATTGYMGGGSGHGGRTYFTIEDLGSTDIDARVSETSYGTSKIEVMLGGDTELETFIEALRWAADTLERISKPSSDTIQ